MNEKLSREKRCRMEKTNRTKFSETKQGKYIYRILEEVIGTLLTSAVLGTSSQKISHFMSPKFVCNVTDCNQNPIFLFIMRNNFKKYKKKKMKIREREQKLNSMDPENTNHLRNMILCNC